MRKFGVVNAFLLIAFCSGPLFASQDGEDDPKKEPTAAKNDEEQDKKNEIKKETKSSDTANKKHGFFGLFSHKKKHPKKEAIPFIFYEPQKPQNNQIQTKACKNDEDNSLLESIIENQQRIEAKIDALIAFLLEPDPGQQRQANFPPPQMSLSKPKAPEKSGPQMISEIRKMRGSMSDQEIRNLLVSPNDNALAMRIDLLRKRVSESMQKMFRDLPKFSEGSKDSNNFIAECKDVWEEYGTIAPLLRNPKQILALSFYMQNALLNEISQHFSPVRDEVFFQATREFIEKMLLELRHGECQVCNDYLDSQVVSEVMIDKNACDIFKGILSRFLTMSAEKTLTVYSKLNFSTNND